MNLLVVSTDRYSQRTIYNGHISKKSAVTISWILVSTID